MNEAQGILGYHGNIVKVENAYLRKKVFDGAENETVVDVPPTSANLLSCPYDKSNNNHTSP